MDKELLIKGDELRDLWSNDKRLTIKGKHYGVRLMSYGQFFLEPEGWKGGEKDGFAPGTLWLELKDSKRNLYGIEKQLFTEQEGL